MGPTNKQAASWGGMYISSNGSFYITNGATNSILVLDKNGNKIKEFGKTDS